MDFFDKLVNHREHNSGLAKGTVFWYRNSARIFGCIVLDIQSTGYYLISISKECEHIPKTIDDVLLEDIYTVAWFSSVDLLPARQVHIIGFIDVVGDFNGRAGFLNSVEGLVITNCGQKATWNHTFRAYSIPDCKMQSLLSPEKLRRIIRQ